MSAPKVFLIGITAIIGTGKTNAIKRFRKTSAIQETLLREHNLDVHVVFVLEPEDMWVIKTEEGESVCFLCILFLTHKRRVALAARVLQGS